MFTSHFRHCEDRTESRLSTSSISSTSSPRKTCLGKPLTSSTPAHSAAQISSIVSSNHREAHVSSIASSDQHAAQISSGLVGPGSDQVLLTQNSGSLVGHHHDNHQSLSGAAAGQGKTSAQATTTLSVSLLKSQPRQPTDARGLQLQLNLNGNTHYIPAALLSDLVLIELCLRI